ncbi:uncharacterized protein LOC110882271 [Helianthus annuus]|uniref:uncharacterized protein LOC110882271 n=1 Tax=Helianthus annuus TaxID=4232 RepID=UPI000B8FC9CD|nr:uncharacterized protein LOC110882271 [Helianthus annuus]
MAERQDLFESFAHTDYEQWSVARNSIPVSNLQITVNEISRKLQERPPSQFLSNTQQNPEAQLKALLTRSGKTLGEVVRDEVVEEVEEELVDEEIEMEAPVEINLLFIEALQSMPKYAKFLKDLLKRKDRLGAISNIPLTGGCSAVILNKVPEKLTDLGLFNIPCLFGSDTKYRALGDLGASINLMPYSLYQKLDLGELSPTRMSLSLADRSVKYPRGVVENLLVTVDKFVFPVDFVILDMEADERVPIILGCPFLCTVKAIINVFHGNITLRVGEETITFECLDFISGADLVGKGEEEEVEEVVEECEEEVGTTFVPEVLELSEVREGIERAPIENPIPLERQVLPSHLEYDFSGE